MEGESETHVSTNPPPPPTLPQYAPPQSSTPQSTPLPNTLGKRKLCKNASGVWDHFTKIKCEDDISEPRCIYKYCKKDYARDGKKNGTSTS
ncbi:unnamed protein product [Prunus armeniaca]|uniref:BED-type domain-containing protein n=1 Tax=Prunus armeniaca TaxID=36596 RepID=A0A6J5VAG8_PRUAR|nr:unnamed protein product [Prunus armeniaca]CAB4316447.1 unnamed protein product [Prunus armeniaca]